MTYHVIGDDKERKLVGKLVESFSVGDGNDQTNEKKGATIVDQERGEKLGKRLMHLYEAPTFLMLYKNTFWN